VRPTFSACAFDSYPATKRFKIQAGWEIHGQYLPGNIPGQRYRRGWISPVDAFRANGYGLRDMAGNVWQWCSDWYRPDYFKQLAESGKVARNPQGPEMSFDPAEPKDIQKGGSYLCTDQYCTRYMVGTRGKGEVNTGTNHLGFRCAQNSRLSVSNDKQSAMNLTLKAPTSNHYEKNQSDPFHAPVRLGLCPSAPVVHRPRTRPRPV
jgi:Sulfatase-modifying factor enzyme 1